MSDRPKSIPPFQTSEWEEFAAFRGTFLRLFKPEDADALARVGRLLYDCALECGRGWHRDPETETFGEMSAVASDFRFFCAGDHAAIDRLEAGGRGGRLQERGSLDPPTSKPGLARAVRCRSRGDGSAGSG